MPEYDGHLAEFSLLVLAKLLSLFLGFSQRVKEVVDVLVLLDVFVVYLLFADLGEPGLVQVGRVFGRVLYDLEEPI